MSAITLTAGDGRILLIELDDESIDLTESGTALRWTLRRRRSDGVATIAKRIGAGITVVEAAPHTAEVRIFPAETRALVPGVNYVWDVELTLPGGDPVTVDHGTLIVQDDVSKEEDP